MGKRRTASHEGMVGHVARHLKQRFYQDVRARALGFRAPDRVSLDADGAAWLPDVTMVARGDEFHVIEVETPETLATPQTQERWGPLARYANQRGGSFWLVVPAGLRDAAEDRLRSLDVEARIWEV